MPLLKNQTWFQGWCLSTFKWRSNGKNNRYFWKKHHYCHCYWNTSFHQKINKQLKLWLPRVLTQRRWDFGIVRLLLTIICCERKTACRSKMPGDMSSTTRRYLRCPYVGHREMLDQAWSSSSLKVMRIRYHFSLRPAFPMPGITLLNAPILYAMQPPTKIMPNKDRAVSP